MDSSNRFTSFKFFLSGNVPGRLQASVDRCQYQLPRNDRSADCFQGSIFLWVLAFNVSCNSHVFFADGDDLRVQRQSKISCDFPSFCKCRFTGFINRIRGYASVLANAPGSDKGLLPNTCKLRHELERARVERRFLMYVVIALFFVLVVTQTTMPHCQTSMLCTNTPVSTELFSIENSQQAGEILTKASGRYLIFWRTRRILRTTVKFFSLKNSSFVLDYYYCCI